MYNVRCVWKYKNMIFLTLYIDFGIINFIELEYVYLGRQGQTNQIIIIIL